MEKNKALENTVCPKCTGQLDAATDLQDKDNQPKPGDITICFYCAALLSYNDDLTLCTFDMKEWADIPLDSRNQIGLVRNKILELRKTSQKH